MWWFPWRGKMLEIETSQRVQRMKHREKKKKEKYKEKMSIFWSFQSWLSSAAPAVISSPAKSLPQNPEEISTPCFLY